MYPNICLSNYMCGCDNHFANTKSQINNQIKYCTYLRKSPIITSILEIIMPGSGFIYSGSMKYGIFKFSYGLFVFILLSLQVCKVFRDKKDDLENNNSNKNLQEYYNIPYKHSIITYSKIKENNLMINLHDKITEDKDSENNSFNQNFNLYLLIICYVVLLIWLFIDFVLIGMRINKDGNGVGFTIYANYGNSY